MIQKLLYSNDKSTVQVMPENYKEWFSENCPYLDNASAYSHLFYFFSKYMKSKANKVINRTHKYSVEFYFPYFMIRQLRRTNPNPVFNFYIHFNYIQYLNKSGFNYIKYNSEFEELKPFVQDIIEFYLFHLKEFVGVLYDKWYELTDSKGNYISDKYNISIINLFKEHIIDNLNNSKEVAISNLSVTLDIHFDSVTSKKIFFNTIKNLRQEHYKMFIVEDETIFLYPFNRIYQIDDKNYPKIRFYDKQKDLFHRFKKKLKEKGYLYIGEDEDSKAIFELIDKISHRRDKRLLEKDFIEGYQFLDNVLRFEVDFNKKSLDNSFGSRKLSEFRLNNYDFLIDYLNKLLNQETTSFSESYYDWKDMEYKRRDFKDVIINQLGCSGDVTDKLNFVMKHAEFLNNPFNKSGDARYSKVRRFKEMGVFTGRGKNLVINQPYRSLLDIYNHYYCFDYWNNKMFNEKPKAVLRLRRHN